MWLPKKKLIAVELEVRELNKKIKALEDNFDERLFFLVKKILEQPDELHKEIKDIETIEAFIDDIIRS